MVRPFIANAPLFLQLAILFLINTLIALFLGAINVGHSFVTTFVISQCIGFSIAASCRLALHWLDKSRYRMAGVVASVPVGTLLGVGLSTLLMNPDGAVWPWQTNWQALLIGLIIGSAITALFYLRERMAELEIELSQRRLREMEIEKQRVEAQLKMLQAQIEPHFLFNTLANVTSLIEIDPGQARVLLEHLIRYLRVTLSRTRATGATLKDEVDLLRAYLDVLNIRMNGRIEAHFDIPNEFLGRSFPPMLLQPLVENALKHGLEPKLGKGCIHMEASRQQEKWCIEVRDDGIGFSTESANGGGTGLANVSERLRAIYGPAASLVMEENASGGVTARLELPL